MRYSILDTEVEGPYQDLAALACAICEKPISLITFLDERRQWFKARVGLDVPETPRNIAFCAHALLQEEMLIVEDAQQDPRFCDNPLVTHSPHIRFYAGAPLITPDGYTLGTLCVIDRVPGSLTDAQQKALSVLARQVVSQLELRLNYSQVRQLNQEKNSLIRILSHDVRSSFSTVIGFAKLMASRGATLGPERVLELSEKMRRSAEQGLGLLENSLSWSRLQNNQQTVRDLPVNLLVACQSAAELLNETAQLKQVSIKYEGDHQAQAMVDESLLVSVLKNLAHNAIKFSHPGGVVSLIISQRDQCSCIEVTDHGVGMSEEKAQTLFHDYKGSSEGTADEFGSGIGTMLVRDFVQHYGGSIAVVSQPDKGTSITLNLPSCEPQ